MKAIINEIITHILVVCVVLIVAYGNHDQRAFNLNNEAKNILVDGGPKHIPFYPMVRQICISGIRIGCDNPIFC